ncbi:MAG: hypothetical protein ABSH29_27415 [Acidimicrobiales bacterium]
MAEDLLAEGRSPLGVSLNLLWGAVRIRTRATGMPKIYELWAVRTRISIAAATLPALLMAPLVLVAMGNSSLHSSAGRVTPPSLPFFGAGGADLLIITKHGFVAAPPLAPAVSIVNDAVVAILVLFLVTFVVLIGGWSSLTGAIRRSATPHRRLVVLLAWAPVFSLLADLALIIAQDPERPTRYVGDRAINGNPHAVLVLGTVLSIVAGVGWLVSILCVALAARRAEVAPSDLRYGRTVSLLVAGLLSLLLAAYLCWGIGLAMQTHQAAHGNFTTLVNSRQDIWVPMVVVLSGAAILSTICASTARRSYKVISLITA